MLPKFLHNALKKRALQIDPSTPLLVVMFSASILLFSTCFATQSIYFAEGQVAGEQPSTFVTYGLFTICLYRTGEEGKKCTDPRIGYQLDALNLFSDTVSGSPTTYIPALKGLPIHLAAFIISVFAIGITVVCCQRRTFLSRWIFEIESFVAGIVLVSYFIDIGLFFSLSANLDSQLLFVGNGSWLTFVAFLMLSSAGILFKFHTSYVVQAKLLQVAPLRMSDLENGVNMVTDHTISMTEPQPSRSDLDDKDDFKAQEQSMTSLPKRYGQPCPPDHSRTPSTGNTVIASTAQPFTQPPTTEADPQPPQERTSEDDVEATAISVPSMVWDGLRESTSSRGAVPSSRLLPDSEPASVRASEASRYIRDQQSPYAASSYHAYHHRESSSSSMQTATGLGITLPDDQAEAQVLPSRASSCLNSPITTTRGGKTSIMSKDLSRSGSLASNATTKSRRSYHGMTPLPSPLPIPLPKIPLMPPAPPPSSSVHRQSQPPRQLPPIPIPITIPAPVPDPIPRPRPRIDTSLLQVFPYPPLITAFANDSFASLATPNSNLNSALSESAMSTPQMSPVAQQEQRLDHVR